MKQRILSAIVMVAVCLYPLLFGGWSLMVLVCFCALTAGYELVKMISKDRFNIPVYILYLFFMAIAAYDKSKLPALIPLFLMVLYAISIFDKDFSLQDACLLLSMYIVLAKTVQGFIFIYNTNKLLIIYILLAAFVCDAAAYFCGMAFGKHKLNERISPKKTIEGSIGGWIFAFAISFAFAYFNNFFGFGKLIFAINSIVLPLAGMIGDLAFSLIKRTYGIKDYGNLIPGHGGVLDRIDSLCFCLMLFVAIVGLL